MNSNTAQRGGDAVIANEFPLISGSCYNDYIVVPFAVAKRLRVVITAHYPQTRRVSYVISCAFSTSLRLYLRFPSKRHCFVYSGGICVRAV